MARAKQPTKRNRRSKAIPVLGIAGVSFAMAGGASAATGSATDIPAQNTATHHDLFLGEEEISDVSLSTFYVFDKENAGSTKLEKTAWWGRCGGCGGCAWRRCGGCGGCGCGGCCWSIGRCRAC
jgi:hypothetical protein